MGYLEWRNADATHNYTKETDSKKITLNNRCKNEKWNGNEPSLSLPLTSKFPPKLPKPRNANVQVSVRLNTGRAADQLGLCLPLLPKLLIKNQAEHRIQLIGNPPNTKQHPSLTIQELTRNHLQQIKEIQKAVRRNTHGITLMPFWCYWLRPELMKPRTLSLQESPLTIAKVWNYFYQWYKRPPSICRIFGGTLKQVFF